MKEKKSNKSLYVALGLSVVAIYSIYKIVELNLTLPAFNLMDFSMVNSKEFHEFFKTMKDFNMPHNSVGDFTFDTFFSMSNDERKVFLSVYEKYMNTCMDNGTLSQEQIEQFGKFKDALNGVITINGMIL